MSKKAILETEISYNCTEKVKASHIRKVLNVRKHSLSLLLCGDFVFSCIQLVFVFNLQIDFYIAHAQIFNVFFAISKEVFWSPILLSWQYLADVSLHISIYVKNVL